MLLLFMRLPVYDVRAGDLLLRYLLSKYGFYELFRASRGHQSRILILFLHIFLPYVDDEDPATGDYLLMLGSPVASMT
jgi:hypothetical protein